MSCVCLVSCDSCPVSCAHLVTVYLRVYVNTPADVSTNTPNDPGPNWYDHGVYFQFAYVVNVSIVSSVFTDNSANCTSCSGGALSVSLGGFVTVVDSSFVGNSAGQAGGAVFAGSARWTPATCALHFERVVMANNSAVLGGAQLYDGCPGALTFLDTSVGARPVARGEVDREWIGVESQEKRVWEAKYAVIFLEGIQN